MKVGDLVRVKPENMAHWPRESPSSGTIQSVDALGVELEGGFWVAQYILELVPSSHAMRDNGGKPELSYALTFGDALRALALVSTYGAGKYTRDDYLKGLPLSKSADALLRHLLAWWEGEDTDPESGHGHLAHVVWNALRLCQESLVRPDLDDRISYKKGRASP